jgi:L-Ala-D/L-Glu epimerase
VKLEIQLEHWPLTSPFHIAGKTWVGLDVVVVSLEDRGCIGRGESAGVYYRNDTPDSIVKDIKGVAAAIERGVDRRALQSLLPPGGARNAVDCALWDLEAKLSGRCAWQIAGLDKPRPLVTTFTCSADEPCRMAETARAYAGARAIKLKLTGEPIDADRVQAVRHVLPDVWLGVDANQGLTLEAFQKLLPVLIETNVALVEQPFPASMNEIHDVFRSPIPIAADESVQDLADIPGLVGRFDVVNIKLDKCGGLTEGLAMARAAKTLGLEVMVGNMLGTSLATAPGFLLGQLCSVVDLDGSIPLTSDREPPARYADGYIYCTDDVWGCERRQVGKAL